MDKDKEAALGSIPAVAVNALVCFAVAEATGVPYLVLLLVAILASIISVGFGVGRE